MVADIYLTDVKNGQVKIASEVIADMDVLATVAAERLGNPHSLANAAQHLLQIGILGFIVPTVNGIVFLAPLDGLSLTGYQFFIGIAVLQTSLHFLHLRNSVIPCYFRTTFTSVTMSLCFSSGSVS